MATLYRQYRPGLFSEVVGQEHVTDTLSGAIKGERLAHAYLFYGPRGTGKTTTARILAKRINCQKPKDNEPCGKCKSCLAMNNNTHLDVIEIDAASNRGIDDVRALREQINLMPSMGSYKVYIIDEIHMLTKEASSALLKTLEEPVEHAVFVLATTELQKVLNTISSRCQVFRFRRATKEDMTKRLNVILKKEEREIDQDAIDFIISRSDGCYRDAESLLGQMMAVDEGRITKKSLVQFLGLPDPKLVDQFIAYLVRGESAGSIEMLEKTLASGMDPEQFIKESIVAARDGALCLAKGDSSGASDYQFINETQSQERLPVIIRALLQSLQDIAYVPDPAIAIHLAVLTVCSKKGEVVKRPTPNQVSTPGNQNKNFSSGVNPEDRQEPKEVKNESADSKRSNTELLKKVSSSWDKIIQLVKEQNPVAATFLRAMDPIDAEESSITIRARYSLHRNYFENTDNKNILLKEIERVAEKNITLKIALDEAGIQSAPSLKEVRRQQEDKFEQTVQEIFGSK
jgi:DNA polymerase-3 subunit gamma/tau